MFYSKNKKKYHNAIKKWGASWCKLHGHVNMMWYGVLPCIQEFAVLIAGFGTFFHKL